MKTSELREQSKVLREVAQAQHDLEIYQKQLREVKNLEEDIKKLSQEKISLENTTVSVRTDLAKFEREFDRVERRVVSEEAREKELLKSCVEIQKKSDELSSLIAANIDLNVTLNADIHTANKEIENLKMWDEDIRLQIQKKQDIITSLDERISRLRDTIVEKDAELLRATEKESATVQRISMLTAEYAVLQRNHIQLTEKIKLTNEEQFTLGAQKETEFTKEKQQILLEWNRIKEVRDDLVAQEQLLERKKIALREIKEQLELLNEGPLKIKI